MKHMRPFSILFILAPALASAQPPPGYYDPAAGLTGEPLRAALYDIISPHVVIQYSNLWSAFYRTDRKPDNTVWDIYSDVPSGSAAYAYQFVSDQCGTYNSEGDCFNREHSFPVSWFNDVPPMNSDLFHIYPTDAWVNQARGNWPYGTVTSPDFTSTNGSKRGPCSWPGCSGTVFEPIDAYKGDLARGYFYMLTRYMNESVSWPAPIMTGGQLFSWTESLLVAWHTQDPVSAKEIARNDSAFILQGNRNPYIDNPMWVYSIWGPQAGSTTCIPPPGGFGCRTMRCMYRAMNRQNPRHS
ncbi:MAG: endonuclease [Flavobacteriales bacterium]|nr:endonuclease [Flavobacteriales bacterium]